MLILPSRLPGTPRCVEADPELFFPGYGAGRAATDEALQVCRSCQVTMPCLEQALAEEQGAEHFYGIRGGLTARERKVLLRKGRLPKRLDPATD